MDLAVMVELTTEAEKEGEKAIRAATHPPYEDCLCFDCEGDMVAASYYHARRAATWAYLRRPDLRAS